MARVLVVEDDIHALNIFARTLAAEQFDVHTAASGTAALEALLEASTTVVLSDLRLPDFDGIDLLRRIRARHLATPFIVVTAYSSIQSAVEAIKAGAADYLEKPIPRERLVSAVRRCADDVSSPTDSSLPPVLEAPALMRWVQMVTGVISSPVDPRTLEDWGHIIHAAKPTIENWCRAAKLPSKASLDFARVLRAVVQAGHVHWDPEVSYLRTTERFNG